MRVSISLLCLCVSVVSGGLQNWQEGTTDTPEAALNQWRHMEAQVKTMVDDITRRLTPVMIRMSSEVDLSPRCSGDLLRMILAVRNFKDWAIRMLDATGKPGGGQLLGSSSALGSYDECLAVTAPSQSFVSEESMKGMYCVVQIRPPLPPKPKLLVGARLHPVFRNYTSSMEILENMKKYLGLMYYGSFRVGVCLPSSCSRQEIQDVFGKFTRQYGIYTNVKSCEVRTDLRVDQVQWLIIVLLGLFLLLVILATLVDGFSLLQTDKKTKSLKGPLVQSFSVLHNVRGLINTETTARESSSLNCLGGMRFISMTWVVLGHTNLIIDFNGQRETLVYEQRLKQVTFQAIANATLSVDTFYFITSVLASYILVKRFQEVKPFNAHIIFLKRVWRLLPSILLLLGLATLFPLFGSGPSWTEMSGEVANNCRTNWLPVVLFVNNYIHPFQSCLGHTWYISLDLQFFVIALIFIWVYLKRPALGKGMIVLLIVASSVVTFLVGWTMEIPPTLLPVIPDIPLSAKQAAYSYFQSYSHLGVYSVGLALGTALAKGIEFKMTKRVRIFGWTLATVCNVTVLYVTALWNGDYQDPVGLGPSIYAALHRTCWALGITWVTLNCAQGHGGLVNRVLCWRVFLPLNRLTYLVYLVHFLVIVYSQATLKGMVDATENAMIWRFLGNLSMSLIVACFLRLLFEAPLINLEDVFSQHLTKVVEKRKSLNEEIGCPSPEKIINESQRREHETMTRL